MVFLGDNGDKNIFNTTSIMRGSITDLVPGSYNDMGSIFISSNREISSGTGLSKNERLQFIPRTCFKSIYEAAFSGLGQDASPRNKLGQPLATVCVWQPFSEAPAIAILDMQRTGTSQEKHDVRGFVLSGGEQDSALESYLLTEVVEAWAKSESEVVAAQMYCCTVIQTQPCRGQY